MYVINAKFARLADVSLQEVLGCIGVYVLWRPAADVRPSYLGQGVLLKRIWDHTKRFGSDIEGYIAAMKEGGESRRKTDAEIVEHTLLEAGRRIDQVPLHNEAGGSLAAVFKRGAAGHQTIRVNVLGYHPLRWNMVLSHATSLVWRWDDFGGWDLEDVPWRRS